MKNMLNLYDAALGVYWRVTPFIFSRFNYKNYNRVLRDAKQVNSIQNLICLFEQDPLGLEKWASALLIVSKAEISTKAQYVKLEISLINTSSNE